MGEETIQGSEEKAFLELSSSQLKMIAIVAMFLDHVAYVFVPGGLWLHSLMRTIGRITGPVMFYLLVEGYHHTKNFKKYAFRLALFAVISYVPFIWCFMGALPNIYNYYHLNVMYTLLLGLLLLWVKHHVENLVLRLALIVLLFYCSLIGDWFFLGLFMVVIFDQFRDRPKIKWSLYLIILFALSFIEKLDTIRYIVEQMVSIPNSSQYILDVLRIIFLPELGLLLPMFLLWFYRGKRGKTTKASKWAFYIFYPVHLMAIIVVRFIIYQR
ncbi:fimbrial assembly protein fimC [Clostridia bacterium]|nr:fimbrial assembly protein fimC [Clostridia bacterium]